MAENWRFCLKTKIPFLALGLVSILLALCLFGLFRTVKALDMVIQDELRGISNACDVVRQAAQSDTSYDYETLTQKFYSSVWADLRALDHIAYRVPLYQDYALNDLEIFAMGVAGETDPETQEQNIRIICQVAEKLDQAQEHLDFGYSFLTSRAKTDIVPHLKTIEQLCSGDGA